MPRKSKAERPKPLLDLSLVPGTPAEQRKEATRYLLRREKPISIKKAGGGYAVEVLGTSIGVVPTKDLACSAAHQVGNYRLGLGDFAHTYVDGWCKR